MNIKKLTAKYIFILAMFVIPFFAHAATEGIWCDYDYSSNANYNDSLRYSTYAAVVYSPSVQANTSVPLTIQNLRLSCARTNNPPESCDQTLGQLAGIGDASISSPASISASYSNPGITLYPPGSGGTNTVVEAVLQYNSSRTQNFTAPSEAGTYEIATACQAMGESRTNTIGYVVTAPASFQCNDSLNNDSAEGADTLDPQCHTDCNVNNAGSYVPTHNSETTPPNGTCPAPAVLQLNGRAAFLQVVKNFFASITTLAWAGE